MTFKNLSYREKNRFLWIAVVLLSILCWFLSFSKTFEQMSIHRSLNWVAMQNSDESQNRNFALLRKERLLDTLIQNYSSDSIGFESNFLQNVSLAIEGLPVKLSYDGSRELGEQQSEVLGKEIVLEGAYTDVVLAIAELEKLFFVRRVSYKSSGYRVMLVHNIL